MLAWASSYVVTQTSDALVRCPHSLTLLYNTFDCVTYMCSRARHLLALWWSIVRSTSWAAWWRAPRRCRGTRPSITASRYGVSMQINNLSHLTSFLSQGLLYIVCFYGTDLLPHLQTSPTFQDDWALVLLSSLEPLRYCLGSIRFEFFRLVQSVSVLSDDTLNQLATKYNMATKPTKPQDGSAEEDKTSLKGNVDSFDPVLASAASQQTSLENFFPYDPCLLISMNQLVDKYYRLWRGADRKVADGDEEGEGSSAMTDRSVQDARRDRAYSVASSVLSVGTGACAYSAMNMTGASQHSTASMYTQSMYGNDSLPGSAIMSLGEGMWPIPESHAIPKAPQILGAQGKPSALLDGEPLPVRRPRLNSISSTGSW